MISGVCKGTVFDWTCKIWNDFKYCIKMHNSHILMLKNCIFVELSEKSIINRWKNYSSINNKKKWLQLKELKPKKTY